MTQAERVMKSYLDYIRAESKTETHKRHSKFLATCDYVVESNGLVGDIEGVVHFIWLNSEDENVAIEILEQFFAICGIED